MHNSFKVTIGIPFYNNQEYLALAIESVINQSFVDWELILVDDGSSDSSLEIAKRFERKDSRIRVISDGKNKKLPHRLNQIIDESRGEYIARMDADDLIHPNRLEVQMRFLEKNTRYDLVTTGVVSIDNSNKVYGYRHVKDIYTDFNFVRRAYPIIHASVLAKKEWYKRNKYDESYSRSQDFELWCRTITQNDLRMAVIPQLLYYYREEGNLDAKKILVAYDYGFEIYSKYYNGFNIKEYLKFKFKKNVVLIMESFGLLQNLAKIRNNKNISSNIIAEHQKVVNSIVDIAL